MGQAASSCWDASQEQQGLEKAPAAAGGGYVTLLKHDHAARDPCGSPLPRHASTYCERSPSTEFMHALESLKQQRPRLMISDTDLAYLRHAIHGPLQFEYQQLVKTVEDTADDDDGVHLNAAGVPLLNHSRPFMDRTTGAAALYLAGGSPRYAQLARRRMLHAAQLSVQDWNPAGVPDPGFLAVAEYIVGMACGFDWIHNTLANADKQAVWLAVRDKAMIPALDVFDGRTSFDCTHFDCYHTNIGIIVNAAFCIAALTFAEYDYPLAQRLFAYAMPAVRNAISTFCPHGAWLEGPLYWSFGGWFAGLAMSALETALGTDFGLSSLAGMHETAYFRQHCISPTRKFFNFSDSHEEVLSGNLSYYIAKRFKDGAIYNHENSLHTTGTGFRLLWSTRDVAEARRTPFGSITPCDGYYSGLEVETVFMRTAWDDPQAAYVALKTGSNPTSGHTHRHLDLGTFVYEAAGERWFIDLGAENYACQDMFKPGRFELYRNRTEGHNTLAIAPQQQVPLYYTSQFMGRTAPMTAFHSSPQRSSAVVALSDVYCAQSVKRGVALFKTDPHSSVLLVQDEVYSSHPVDVVSMFHTRAVVLMNPDHRSALLQQNGRTLHARIMQPDSAVFDIITCDPTPRGCSLDPPEDCNAGVSNLIVGSPALVTDTTIVVVFSQNKSVTSGEWFSLQPLSQWPGAK
eukprot:jgi/Chlat1/6903/Chrsp52S06584